MTRAISRTAVFIFVTVLAVALIGGCGGGGDGEPGISDPVNGQAGSVVVHIQWPERAEIDPQLIPELSDFIEVEIRDVATDVVSVSDLLERPEEAPWVTEVTYHDVLASANARLTAAAYPVNPNEDPAAVAQAGGSMQIVIPAGGVAYPRDGSPGDPINLVMDSTVDSVVVTAENGGEPFELEVNETLQLTATAHDADGNMMLVPGFTWSSSESSAAVDQEGLVTGEEIGESEITATEVESGVSGSVTVAVSGEEEEEPTCVFRGRDDAVHSPGGSVRASSRAYLDDRYAMQIEPIRSGRIGIFDRETDELLVEIAALPDGETNPLKGLAWAPDGAHIAVMYHYLIGVSHATIYDATTGRRQLRVRVSWWHYMVFSDDGTRLCFSYRGTEVDGIRVITADEVPITISDTEGGRE